MSPRPLLEVRDLAVSFAPPSRPLVRAVDGVSLTVYPRQIVAIVGESGSGKTVTALSLPRLIDMPPGRIDRGRAIFRPDDAPEGVDLLAMSTRDVRRLCGSGLACIFQEPMTSLNPVLTIGAQIVEAVRLHSRVSVRAARGSAIEALEAVGIGDAARRVDEYPHRLSGGMRQRAMIAMALACRPRLLIADEPTTALDAGTRTQVLDLLHTLRERQGTAVLLITHDLGLVARHADVVCVMYAGRVVEYAPAPRLFARPQHPYTKALLGSTPSMRRPRPRLQSLPEILEDPARFHHASEVPAGTRAWWPRHGGEDSRAKPVLLRTAKDHWVSVRPGGMADAADTSPPDCPWRVGQ